VIYMPLAIEIANDRAREAELFIRRREAAREASAAAPRDPRRPSRVRELAARPVRALGDASHALSEAACSAATRIEGVAR
jgi:hypothetical protein